MRQPSGASKKRVMLSFGLIYFVSMFVKAAFGPFVTVFLSEKGLSADLIGIVTGISSIVIIVMQPLWGVAADRVGSTKKTLVVSIGGQALFALTLVFANGFLLLASMFACYTAFTSAEGSLLDIWCMKSVESVGEKNATGQLKLWGCVGFALSSAISGLVVNRFSVVSIIPVYAGILCVLALLFGFMKDHTHPQGAASLKDMGLSSVLKDKALIAFLVYVFFMQITHRGSYTFYSLLIKRMGGSTSIVGYASALMFVSEAVVMAVLKRLLKRIRPVYLVMISSLAFALWFVFIRMAASPWHVMLSCLMDGPSFALFTMGTLYYIAEIAPSRLRTTYQTIAYSVYYGLSGIAGNVICGYVIERFGYKTMYDCGIVLTLLSTAVFFVYMRTRQASPDKPLP